MKLLNIFKKKTRVSPTSSIEAIDKTQLEKVIGGGSDSKGSALAQGASLLGGALPGGAVISAAVKSTSTMAGGSGSGAAAASYAATG
jgi:hypothetical protein